MSDPTKDLNKQRSLNPSQSTPSGQSTESDITSEIDQAMIDRPSRKGRLFALLMSGLSLYLIVFWFGITIVGDTVLRSGLMAALIVTIAGTGFVHTRRSTTLSED